MKLNALNTLPIRQQVPQGLLAKGKAFVQLYKTGVVNVWHNRTTTKQILAQYGVRNAADLSRAIVENTHLKAIQDHHGNTTPQKEGINRAQLLTVLRTAKDWPKLPGFAVIFGVFFELTPLLLLAMPRLSPSTCYSPSFIAKLDEYYKQNRATLHQIPNTPNDGSLSVYRVPVPILRQLAATVCGGPSILYKLAPERWIRYRLNQHLVEVRADDCLLRKGNLSELEPEELKKACMARAMNLDDGTDKLQKWLDTFVEPMDIAYFITFDKNA